MRRRNPAGDLMSVKESASILAHLLRIGGTCARQAEPNEA